MGVKGGRVGYGERVCLSIDGVLERERNEREMGVGMMMCGWVIG